MLTLCFCTALLLSTGADLQASAANVGNSLPGGARGYLGYVTTHINTPQILPFLEAAVEARTEISHALVGNRDLLYLDVALENSIRGAAERGVGSAGRLCAYVKGYSMGVLMEGIHVYDV
jgi:hypothetical protein